ncbi:hypothetical protein CYMTET_56530 [Cymbomonas tetramitiformis]|uniref:Uncharacterized protein n=1 Tax=Cymbomonas tetramitiformis TaxID=36881 RepID=A0AAE0BAP7_9CHLO|nr:hypothetical protein CYMTET_56530 [Cymbomonas tetramitiformis]
MDARRMLERRCGRSDIASDNPGGLAQEWNQRIQEDLDAAEFDRILKTSHGFSERKRHINGALNLESGDFSAIDVIDPLSEESQPKQSGLLDFLSSSSQPQGFAELKQQDPTIHEDPWEAIPREVYELGRPVLSAGANPKEAQSSIKDRLSDFRELKEQAAARTAAYPPGHPNRVLQRQEIMLGDRGEGCAPTKQQDQAVASVMATLANHVAGVPQQSPLASSLKGALEEGKQQGHIGRMQSGAAVVAFDGGYVCPDEGTQRRFEGMVQLEKRPILMGTMIVSGWYISRFAFGLL